MKVEDERYSRKIKVKVGGKKDNAKRKQEEKGEKCKLKGECIRVKSARKISNGINCKSEKIKDTKDKIFIVDGTDHTKF